MRLFAKSPMQMRREAEERRKPKRAPAPGPVDPAKRPSLASESPREIDAAAEWLAYLRTGRTRG